LTPSSGIPDFRAQINISATASTGCGLGGAFSCSGTAVIRAYAAFTATSSDGGALLSLIPGALGIPVGTVFFDIECANTSYTIVPNTRIAVNCAMYTILSLSFLSLLGVVNVGADISVSGTSGIQSAAIAPGWDTPYTGQTASLLNISAQPVAGVGLLNFSKFTVYLTAGGTCGVSIPTGNLDSLLVGAVYHLTVLGAVAVPLSSGTSAVPVKVEGTSTTAAPSISINNVNFGSYTYNGSSYSTAASNPTMTVTLSAPTTTTCVISPWKVTAAYSTLAGYQDSGHITLLSPATSIPVSAISYFGSPTGGTGTVVPVASLPAPSAAVAKIIDGTDQLAMSKAVVFTLKLTPPNSQRAGYYQGSVTVTTGAGP